MRSGELYIDRVERRKTTFRGRTFGRALPHYTASSNSFFTRAAVVKPLHVFTPFVLNVWSEQHRRGDYLNT